MQTFDVTIGAATKPDKRAYTIPEAVFVSGLGRTALYEANAKGRLSFRKYGKRTIVLADDLEGFLASLPISAAA